MTDPGRMRLRTIQTKESWERAEKLGVLEFSEIVDKEIDDWFGLAYGWTTRRTGERISLQQISDMGMASPKTGSAERRYRLASKRYM